MICIGACAADGWLACSGAGNGVGEILNKH